MSVVEMVCFSFSPILPKDLQLLPTILQEMIPHDSCSGKFVFFKWLWKSIKLLHRRVVCQEKALNTKKQKQNLCTYLGTCI